jgi:DNA-binding response OmpR family regulator
MSQLLLCVDGAVKQYANTHQSCRPGSSWSQPERDLRSENTLVADAKPMVPPVAANQQGERYLHEGELRLDRNHYLAFFEERQIALTPIEYALLFCMLEAKGRVLPYQELVRYSHGYQMSSVEAQTLLKPHIYHLRRKIDSSYLINVRGIGYMLSASQRHTSAV